jgi:hypothetical protein
MLLLPPPPSSYHQQALRSDDGRRRSLSPRPPARRASPPGSHRYGAGYAPLAPTAAVSPYLAPPPSSRAKPAPSPAPSCVTQSRLHASIVRELELAYAREVLKDQDVNPNHVDQLERLPAERAHEVGACMYCNV